MNIKWNAEKYAEDFQFVHKYGEDVLSLLDINDGDSVVDLGCGNGRLSVKIKEMGANVIGVDDSEDMLKIAVKNYSDINFIKGNALSFKLKDKADAIFSNAVFHWVDECNQQNLLNNVSDNLKTGGQLVCEFGGKGCAENIHSELEKIFALKGLNYKRTFYFPTIGEYSPLIEKAGMEVRYAVLFERPTRLVGENGLADWINMFDTAPFEGVSENLRNEIINEAVENLREKLYIDGSWYADYVRIRFKAVKL